MQELTPHAKAAAQARREREAAALRENLRRRKAQARALEDGSAQPPGKSGDQPGPLPPENLKAGR